MVAGMVVVEIEAKSILRKHQKIDSWFLSNYGMNLYRGCQHNCVYCDGRAEKYNVQGEFGCDVAVKANAIEILRRELDPRRKRTPFPRSYLMVGGGVGDSYQPIERKYELTRRTLELLYEKKFPVHILTKSTLVERDIDVLQKINQASRAIVSFSFSSTDEHISRIFEPGVPSPQERLDTIASFKQQGIACGMFLLPVIPFVTDTRAVLEKTIRDAKEAGVDFIIFGGMTLKEGKQKEYFSRILQQHYPSLTPEYQMIYRGSLWGEPVPEYTSQLQQTFHALIKYYRIPARIPPRLFKDLLSDTDKVIVILEHLDYLLKLEGKKSSFGYAAYSISQLHHPLSTMANTLCFIKGVGPVTARIIQEILESGTSHDYETLLLKSTE
jgi:DNA repair photolyase